MPRYNNQPLTPQNFLKVMIIIHLALFMGQAMFAAVSIFIVTNGQTKLHPDNNVFFIIAPVLVLAGIIGGTLLYRKLMENVSEKETLKEKLALYQTALIIRYAPSEGASLFCVVCYLLGGNYLFLCIMAVNVVYFVLIRPNKFKMADDLKLTMEEQSEMEGAKSEV